MMSPTIRVDQDVYRALQSKAQPFVDTPNSVLRRLLALPIGGGDSPSDDSTGGSGSSDLPATSSRIGAGILLPHSAYVVPILATVAKNGGQARSRDVVAKVGQILRDRLTPQDRERLPSGWIRWENRAHWVRFKLVEQGYLARGVPRGMWVLTDAGRKYVADKGD